jgi:hypothetical protein
MRCIRGIGLRDYVKEDYSTDIILKDEPYAKTRINLRIVWKNIISLRILGVPVETCNRISQLTNLRITSPAKTPLRFLLWKRFFFTVLIFYTKVGNQESHSFLPFENISSVFMCIQQCERNEKPHKMNAVSTF